MPPPSEASRLAAADWLARIDAGLSPDEEQLFESWLALPEQAEAWREVQRPWIRLNRVREAGHAPAMILELANRAQSRRRRRQRHWLAAFATAAAIAVGFFLWPVPVESNGHPVFGRPGHPVVIKSAEVSVGNTTVTLVRPDLYNLADGTVVELNAGAALRVSFSERRRDIHLLSGEAHFTVAHDSNRPFFVRTGAVEVRAVGTAFAVETSDRTADVLVTEGQVGIVRYQTAREQPGPLLVSAGGRVQIPFAEGGDMPRVEQLGAMEIAQRLLWRGPKLRLTGAPLAEIVERLNQVNRVQIAIGDPTLGGLRFSGTFPADDVEAVVRILVGGNYGIKAEESIHDTIVLRRK